MDSDASPNPLVSVALLRELAATRPRNDEELDLYLRIILGARLPRRVVSGADSLSPFQYVADCFFERVGDVLTMACRDGMKTFGLSLIHLLNSVHKPGCQSVSVGAVERQAKKCYAYVSAGLKRTCAQAGASLQTEDPEEIGLFGGFPKGSVVTNSIESRTTFANGSELFILPGTMSGVSGEHPQKTAADEVERWDWKTLQQFMGMASSGVSNYAPQRIFVSTREGVSGTMNRLVDNKDKMGLTLYKWTIWDVMQGCRQRFGGCLCHRGGAGQVDRTACNLYDACQLRALDAEGPKTREEVAQLFRVTDEVTWTTQYECSKPSSHGIVYHTFDPAIHVTTEAEFNPDLSILLGGDPGYEDPYVILLAHRTRYSIDVFDELYVHHCEPRDVKRILTTGEWPVDPEAPWADNFVRGYLRIEQGRFGTVASNVETMGLDPHYPDEEAVWCRSDNLDGFQLPSIRCRCLPAHSIRERISAVRQQMRVGEMGPTLRVHPRCRKLIWELTQGYRYSIDSRTGQINGDKPLDLDNHCADTLGYLVLAANGPRAGVR